MLLLVSMLARMKQM
jgi:hypothetical protein